MPTILEEISQNRNSYYKTILENISEYIYREKRYNSHFSLTLIYHDKNIRVDAKKVQNSLRETDMLIALHSNIFCVVFDETGAESCIRAAENLNKTLQKMYYNEKFFVSAADSMDFDANYLDMSNKLFDRITYAISHKQCNIVICQDYLV
jgi:GGDEF domain-containing protein